jgi:preprotein translocase subunit SecG
METIVWVVHIIAALSVIGLVLLQHGKGADMGAAFGSGTSGSLFGVSGASNFLSRTTAILVAVFFCTSLGLTYFSGHRDTQSSIVKQQLQQVQPKPLPALPSLDKEKNLPAPAKSKEIPQ